MQVLKMDRERGKNGLFACPCCGYATLSESSAWEICKICFWEDDGQDDPKANENWGGPNKVSLYEGRKNFLAYGASDPKHKEHVRDINIDDERVRKYALKDETVVVLNAS